MIKKSKTHFTLLLLLLFVVPLSKAQTTRRKVYLTTSSELIFSFATLDNNGSSKGNVMRFSPVFNFQNWLHYDYRPHFGFFIGSSMRNVGFIYDEPDSPIKKKFRTYSVGLPVGIKLGNFKKFSVFAGYELELPFHYKEKTFIDEKKVDKTSIWFSHRVPTLSHSLMAGFQLPSGVAIKFKYYLTPFFNQDYVGVDPAGQPYKPFENFEAHVFYFSLNFNLLKNSRFYHSDSKDKETDMKQAMNPF